MKQIIFIILSAAAGFLTSILVLNNFSIDFNLYAEPIQIGLLVIIVVLLLLSLIKFTQIKNLSKKEVVGDEEDEVDILKYKGFTDFSLFSNSSFVLSILTVCISAITNSEMIYVVLGIAAVIVSYIFSILTTYLLKWAYPDREMPKVSDKKYADKLLAISDEGERHIMLIGLYKSYYFVTFALVIAIILATLYSVSSGHSQLFSIIIMSIVLLLTHGKYGLSIRNK